MNIQLLEAMLKVIQHLVATIDDQQDELQVQKQEIERLKMQLD